MLWGRAISPSEIQQLADPSNVMLSGLILPPTRRLWGVGGGIAPVALVVGDAECVVASESPSLTQHQVLAVGNAESIVDSEAPTLTQHQVLVVGGCQSLVESEAPALTQHYQALAVADSACVVESESPVLTQHHVLTVGDARCIVASQNVALSVGAGAGVIFAQQSIFMAM
jgi:hypothetical protein